MYNIYIIMESEFNKENKTLTINIKNKKRWLVINDIINNLLLETYNDELNLLKEKLEKYEHKKKK